MPKKVHSDIITKKKRKRERESITSIVRHAIQIEGEKNVASILFKSIPNQSLFMPPSAREWCDIVFFPNMQIDSQNECHLHARQIGSNCFDGITTFGCDFELIFEKKIAVNLIILNAFKRRILKIKMTKKNIPKINEKRDVLFQQPSNSSRHIVKKKNTNKCFIANSAKTATQTQT